MRNQTAPRGKTILFGKSGFPLLGSWGQASSLLAIEQQTTYLKAGVLLMNLERLDRITVEEGKCGGRPCIRGQRIRVTDVLELLGAGASLRKSWLIIPLWNATIFSPPLTTLPIRLTTLCFELREIPA